MINYIMICLISVSSGFVISEFIIDISHKYFNKFPIKPFSCGYCLSFWIGWYLSIYYKIELLEMPFYAFSSAYTYYVLNRLLNRP